MSFPKIFLVLCAPLLVACSGAQRVGDANPNANTEATAAAASNKSMAQEGSAGEAAPASDNPAAAESAATSTTYTHRAAGVEFEVPAGFSIREAGNRLLVTSPDGSLAVVFYVPDDEEEFERTVANATEELAGVVDEARVTQPGEEGTLNGMRTYSIGGTGLAEGAPVEWDLTAVEAEKTLFVVSFAEPARFAAHEASYQRLIRSIRMIPR